MSWSIGKSAYRKEALDKVTGDAKYIADQAIQTLHVKLVVSSYAHAKINFIHTEKAREVPGVRAILLGQPSPLTGEDIQDRPPIAYDRVRYHGEPVAAVIADHPVQAKKSRRIDRSILSTAACSQFS